MNRQEAMPEKSPRILSSMALIGLEKLYCLHGGWLTIGHAAHLTGNSTILVNNIASVIPHLLKRHSRMRTRIRINNDAYVLDTLDYHEEYFHSSLFYSIRNSTDQTWQQIIDEECNRNPYSNDGSLAFPLFRFILVYDRVLAESNVQQSFHLLLFSHHTVSDGRSGFILINDFLTLATSPDLHQHVEPVNSTVHPLLINFIRRPYGPLYRSLSFVAKRMFERELRKLNHPRIPVKATYLPNQSTRFTLKPMKTNFLFSSTSSNLFKRLHAKCREEQVTLHGPLFACLLLTIQYCFPTDDDNPENLNVLNLDLDFDLRQRLPRSPLTPTTVGFCVGISPIKIKHRFPLQTSSFWRLARKCISATNKVLSSKEVHFTQHLLRDVLNDNRVFNRMVTQAPLGRLSEVNFSNIGKYPFETEYHQGQLRLQGIHVVNNGSIYRTSTVVFVTCVGNQQLDVALAHEMESESKAQEFLGTYIRFIEICADANRNITLQQLFDQVNS